MSDWSKDRVALMLKLYSDGYSASQIAARMGGVTRNAVIGKINRMGVPPPLTAKRPRDPRAVVPEAPRPKRVVAQSAPAPPSRPVFLPAAPVKPEQVVVPPAERKALIDLQPGDCRWPIGDPAHDPDFGFCGRSSVAGLPYCEGHRNAAYQPPKPRRPSAQAKIANHQKEDVVA